ncbi:MAG TPA: hypothetical protein VME17_06685 [Bryobacteraceae bacterium]|nr:hypothetical protein [Bryobacteraceae bacterium]
MGAAAFVMFATMGWAVNHHELNGTWQLVPTRSVLNGEPAVKSGTVSIRDHEGNISISRNFDFDAANTNFNGSFSTSARAGTAIKQPGLWSKSKWEGDVLKVTTVQNGITTVERYSLLNDGTMMEEVTRTGHHPETFYFEHQ